MSSLELPATTRGVTRSRKIHVVNNAAACGVWLSPPFCEFNATYTIWLFNIAMENGPFIDGLPIKNRDFPWLC